ICAFALSVATSPRVLVSGLELMRILAVVVMFVVLEELMTEPGMRKRVLAAVYASLAVPLLYTTALIAAGHPPSEVKGDFTRLTGTFTQSNTFGRYLMLMIVFGVAIHPYLSRRARRWLT